LWWCFFGFGLTHLPPFLTFPFEHRFGVGLAGPWKPAEPAEGTLGGEVEPLRHASPSQGGAGGGGFWEARPPSTRTS
jgi:hypothetical protein